MATQTFLNEEESAAMPGMSSLSTMLATTPGTCVQAFHTLHWICDREKRRLRNYSRIFVDLFLPVVPQTSVLNKVHFYWLKLACIRVSAERSHRLHRPTHTSNVNKEGEGEAEGEKRRLKRGFERLIGVFRDRATIQNRETIETKR